MKEDYLTRCISEYGRHVYSFCTYLTRNKQDAEDLYQQTFLTAVEKGDLDEGSNPKSYLITIATNIWNNHKRKYLWRKQKVDVLYMEGEAWGELSQESETMEERVARQDAQARVRQLVYELPYKMKIVVLMFYMEEMSVEEISRALKIPTGTVKSRLHQAKERMRERLVDSYEEGYGYFVDGGACPQCHAQQ